MTIALAKPDYYVIVNGDGEILAVEPVPATPDERSALNAEATIACLSVHEVTANTPEDAADQVRHTLAAQIADDIANEAPDTPAEARRRIVSAWIDRV
ncbi:hypothetical protein AB0G49_14210 [Streptomyces longwoodensis]|uniref:hypothetical protein n=1 Tax=Streptomyces longwoodensis TaxID=68231 RepID=UPI0033E205D5